MQLERLALIGCGLMGGSFALALKGAGLVRQVTGYSKSAASTQRALEMGVIDQALPTAAEAVQGADLVLLAVPVAATEPTFRDIAAHLVPSVLLMDVGSTKADVVAAAARALGDRLPRFVGAHPICGKEVAGIEHADAHLYSRQQVLLTPTADTAPDALARARAVWGALGCRLREIAPEQHDRACAAISHFPHLLAFALMDSLLGQDEAELFLALAGPGFRDTTRIAAGDPPLWRDVLLANRTEVLRQSEQLKASLAALEHLMAEPDGQALRERIATASARRAAWRLGGA